MRRLALFAALLTALPLLVAAGDAGPGQLVYEVHDIETRFEGVTIRVEVQRYDGLDDQGALLTYSPYHNLDDAFTEGQPASAGLSDSLRRQGIARVTADVAGTRGSTGCWDYGGVLETETGIDVVKWIADQPWSNGRVVMTGGSYNGTTANMVASRGAEVPELVGIVPEAAIAQWYGYSYFDGVRWNLNSEDPTSEGVDTPLAFDFGFAYTLPPDEQAATVAQSRLDPCDRVEHTERGYDRTPDYDQFWLDRDYTVRPEAFRAAVLITHGWQDVNVKPNEALKMFDAIPVDGLETPEVEGVPFKRLWMTQGGHSSAGGGGFEQLYQDFLFQTLFGEDRGLTDEQVAVRSVTADADGDTIPRTSAAWPPAGTEDVALNLGRFFTYPGPVQEGLVGSDDEVGYLSTGEVPSTQWAWFDGAGAEPAILEETHGDDGHGYTSLYYTSPPLAEDVRVPGGPRLEALVSNQVGQGTHLTPIIVDIAPDGTTTPIHRGFLNLDYRDGNAAADPMPADTPTHVSVDFLPKDHVFRAGHRIGLVVRSTNASWALPGTPGGLWSIWHGAHDGLTDFGARLQLPVVDPPAELFSEEPPADPNAG